MPETIATQIEQELNQLRNNLHTFKSRMQYLELAKENMEAAIEVADSAEKTLNANVVEIKKVYDSFLSLDEIIQNLVQQLDKVDFPKRLTGIEQKMDDTLSSLENTKTATIEAVREASQAILDADFDNKFIDLDKRISEVIKTGQDLNETIESQNFATRFVSLESGIDAALQKSTTTLTEKTKTILAENAKVITDLNLTIKFEKLDANVSGIMAAVQHVQSRVENVDRNISDRMRDTAEKNAQTLDEFTKKINQRVMGLQESMQTNQKMTQQMLLATWVLMIIGWVVVYLLLR